MCAHRFAPLSEGRIVVQVQPQLLQPDDKDGNTDEDDVTNGRSKVKPVQSFPVQLDVWVWADSNPETADMSTAIDLPVSPLLRRHHQEYGDECCFMRDLPYGMELLEKTFWIYLIYPSPIILLVH